MAIQKRCSAGIKDNQWHRERPCNNPAKVVVDGKPYCGIHDPEKVKARRAESNRKYMAQLSQKKVQWTREALERETCWGVPTETLRAGLLKELLEEYDRCPRNHGIE
jgi:hypothetical protein